MDMQCLVIDPHMNTHVVLQAIRWSLRGTARKMLTPLGERASVEDILSKLETLFGEAVTNGRNVFYFFQKPGVSVTNFGC